MAKQLNVKLSKNLLRAAEEYAKNYGFRNVQELIAESMREKIFEENPYDETFTEKEINLIDGLISESIEKKKLINEEEMNKLLLGK